MWQLLITMRTYFLFILFAFFSSYSQAQIVTTSYHTKNGKITTNMDSAFFYKNSIQPKDKHAPQIVEEYYVSTKTLKSKGTLNKNSAYWLIGKAYQYYPSGNLKDEETYADNGRLIDTAFYYHPNGNVKLIFYYPFKQKHKKEITVTDYLILTYADSTGKVWLTNGTGYAQLNPATHSTEEGHFVAHKKDGTWKGSFLNKKYTFKEEYKNGILISGVTTDTLGIETTYNQDNFEIAPKYPGGINALRRFVAREYRYPKKAVSLGISGTVIINFIIEADGTMSNLAVHKDLGYETDPRV